MGNPDRNMVILRDQQGNKSNILKALNQLSLMATDGGRAFIYFSGHGTRGYDPVSKQCYEGLLSYDRQEITNQEIANATKNLNQNVDKTLIFFDACHSGGVLNKNSVTRSGVSSSLTPKFFSKPDLNSSQCAQATNIKTRNIFDSSTRLGAIQENLVYISAAKPDEVSYDEGVNKGGIATQAVRDCLLGRAKDLNGSGAISLEEIRACSQELINQKLTGPVYLPHHVTIRGNRNLIPVAVLPTPSKPEGGVSNTPIKPTNSSNPSIKPPEEVKPVQQNAPVISSKPPEVLPVSVSQFDSPSPTVEKPLASIGTLRDIESQRNPTRILEVKAAKTSLKINQDYLDLQIKSNQDGYVYIVLLGTDQKSFYLLYPNKLDQDNFIRAGKVLQIPKKDWQIKAVGPPGKDHLLIVVTESKRELGSLESYGADPNSPFVYTLANMAGRTNLISYLTNGKSPNQSEKFGAKIITINEVK